MANYHYQLLIDSKTGKRLSHFWRNCMKCEQEAEKYAKKMGGQYYLSDPNYFAGGVCYISFPGNKPSDPKMWREVGTVYEDGSFVEAKADGYKGAQSPKDVVYFEPNVRQRVSWEEIPDKDYQPSGSFDTIYSDKPMMKNDDKGQPHYYLQCLHFIYDEPRGHSGAAYPAPRTASRSVRRAIKAEMKRKRLPVMGVEPLLDLLGADWLQTDTADGKPKQRLVSTPTFFAFENYYFIGCDYECKAEGLKAISPQTHRTNQDRFEIASRRQGS